MGACRIVEGIGPELPDHYVGIISYAGRRLVTVTGDYIQDIEVIPIKSGREQALIIETYPSGTLRSDKWSYILVKRHGVHNIGILSGVNVSVGTGAVDGYPNLVDDNYLVFEGSADFCNACSPWNIAIVFAWNGKYYSGATRRFPDDSLVLAAKYRRNLIFDIHHYTVDDNNSGPKTHVEYDLATFYGNMAMIGRSPAAERWIIHHAPQDIRQWFLCYRNDFDSRVMLWRGSAYQNDQESYNLSGGN